MPPKKKPSSKPKIKKYREKESSELVEEEYYVPEQNKKTNACMSIYEYTALIRHRALQLGTPGTRPNIELDPDNCTPQDYDPINIATKEVLLGLTSLIIRRTLTDGTTEDWKPTDMTFPRI